MRIEITLPESAIPGQYGVYYLRAANRDILYIGRTKDLPRRLAGHAATKDWWGDVRELQWIPCADYAEAVQLERHAIEDDADTSANILSRVPIKSRCRQELPSATRERLLGMYATEDWENLHPYVWALRNVGWTLQVIGDALGVTREAVRLMSLNAAHDYDLWVPRPIAYPKASKTVRPTLGRTELAQMQELHRAATKLRGVHGEDHPYRQASRDLTDLIVLALARGVRRRDVAEGLGLTVGAIDMRMKLHGYKACPPSMQRKAFETHVHPVVLGSYKTHCKAGHEMSGDNLRLVNGDPSKRQCRECSRISSRAYQQRKRSAA